MPMGLNYRLKIVYPLRTISILTHIKIIFYCSVLNTIFIFYRMWHQRTWQDFAHLYLESSHSLSQMWDPPWWLYFRSSRHCLGATITSSPLDGPLIGTFSFCYKVVHRMVLDVINLLSVRQTPIWRRCHWKPPLPLRKLTPFLRGADSLLRQNGDDSLSNRESKTCLA